MSPFLLLALVGPAVALHVAETMHEAYPDRYYVSPNLARLVAAKKPGIYTWGPEGQQVDPEVAALFAPPADAVALTAEEVRERALSAMAEEISIMLAEVVLAEAEDVDLCLLLAARWPFWMAGFTPYLARSGIAEKVTGKRFPPKGLAWPE